MNEEHGPICQQEHESGIGASPLNVAMSRSQFSVTGQVLSVRAHEGWGSPRGPACAPALDTCVRGLRWVRELGEVASPWDLTVELWEPS